MWNLILAMWDTKKSVLVVNTSKYLFKINEAAIYIPVKQGVAM